jgi:hypothetical protein
VRGARALCRGVRPPMDAALARELGRRVAPSRRSRLLAGASRRAEDERGWEEGESALGAIEARAALGIAILRQGHAQEGAAATSARLRAAVPCDAPTVVGVVRERPGAVRWLELLRAAAHTPYACAIDVEEVRPQAAPCARRGRARDPGRPSGRHAAEAVRRSWAGLSQAHRPVAPAALTVGGGSRPATYAMAP